MRNYTTTLLSLSYSRKLFLSNGCSSLQPTRLQLIIGLPRAPLASVPTALELPWSLSPLPPLSPTGFPRHWTAKLCPGSQKTLAEPPVSFHVFEVVPRPLPYRSDCPRDDVQLSLVSFPTPSVTRHWASFSEPLS